MPPRSSLYHHVDMILDGKLDETLRELRESGCSFDAIGQELYAKSQISVSSQTIANWLAAPAEATK